MPGLGVGVGRGWSTALISRCVKRAPHVHQSSIHLLLRPVVTVLGIKMTTACPCPPRAYRLVVLIMNNPSSYYVGASGYELRQRGEGKVQLLECPHLAAPARELPGTAVQAQLSGLSPSLLPACPSSGESSNPHVCASLQRVISCLFPPLILTILGGVTLPALWGAN